MMKLVGSVLVFAAGGMVWTYRRQGRRRQRELLGELAAALERMSAEIRLNRTPLPTLLQKLAEACGSEASALFVETNRALAAGDTPLEAWRRAVDALPLSESERRALLEIGTAMQGSEENICKAIVLASDALRDSLFQLERQRPAEDRQTTALCFSAAALVVILLI